MKILSVLLAVVAATQAISLNDLIREEWEAFKKEHNKIYESEVGEKSRLKMYMENKHKIGKHNLKYKMGRTTFRLKHNKYGDLLIDEFVHIMNGFNRTHNSAVKDRDYRAATFTQPADATVPSDLDWRKRGAVTDVKDQGICASCWSFSATGALEGQHFRTSGSLVSLSEQNLIDCSAAYDNNGCHGGLMDNAFKYVKDNRGIDTEQTYPYEARDDKCRYNSTNSGADDVGYAVIPAGDEVKLMQAVAAIGPVSVAIDASLDTFQLYSDGVYYDENCSSEKLDHGVLVVGYGTENGTDYWLVKNSWGRSWGEDGYIKMARNKNNHCGIASHASYPLV